jgi:ornithine cyclodeaminase/alanine dehydrogenase-like protein (mu-crystallin family)
VIPHLDEAAIRRAVPMADAIDAVRRAFAAHPRHVSRTHIETSAGDLLVMPAAFDGFAGVKSIVVRPGRIAGVYTLLDLDDARTVATMDGGALTEIRTAAASAVAVDALAAEDASTLGIFGAGPQARAHVAAMRLVRPSIERVVHVRSNGDPSARRLAARCDVVCTCTSSSSPVLDAANVSEHAVVAAIGSYRPGWAEVPTSLVACSEVWVDDLDAAKVEAGDLIAAVGAGWSWDAVRGDLADLASGQVGRGDRPAIFKSVGLAVEDLVVARLAWERVGMLDLP